MARWVDFYDVVTHSIIIPNNFAQYPAKHTNPLPWTSPINNWKQLSTNKSKWGPTNTLQQYLERLLPITCSGISFSWAEWWSTTYPLIVILNLKTHWLTWLQTTIGQILVDIPLSHWNDSVGMLSSNNHDQIGQIITMRFVMSCNYWIEQQQSLFF